MLSGRRLVGFDNLDSAYQDWLRAIRTSPAFTAKQPLHLEAFEKDYLIGQRNVDGLIWSANRRKSAPIAGSTVVDLNSNSDIEVTETAHATPTITKKTKKRKTKQITNSSPVPPSSSQPPTPTVSTPAATPGVSVSGSVIPARTSTMSPGFYTSQPIAGDGDGDGDDEANPKKKAKNKERTTVKPSDPCSKINTTVDGTATLLFSSNSNKPGVSTDVVADAGIPRTPGPATKPPQPAETSLPVNPSIIIAQALLPTKDKEKNNEKDTAAMRPSEEDDELAVAEKAKAVIDAIDIGGSEFQTTFSTSRTITYDTPVATTAAIAAGSILQGSLQSVTKKRSLEEGETVPQEPPTKKPIH